MEQLFAFVNNADFTLHGTQINEFELGNSTRKRFVGNHFLLSRRSRVEHMKSQKCQSFTFLQVKQVDLSRLTSLALTLATSSLEITFSLRSRVINKKRSTCGKSKPFSYGVI